MWTNVTVDTDVATVSESVGSGQDDRMTTRRVPWLTVAVFAVTGACHGWQVADPGVLRTLRRDPSGLHWSSAWRVATPLLIQSDGVAQAVFNLTTLLVFGVFVEWAFGRRAWLVGYLGAGVVGQLVGYAWNPPGGGNSVAVCGLVGLIVAALLVGRPVLAGPAVILAPYYPAALLGLDIAGWTGQVIAVVATAAVVGVCVVSSRGAGGPDQPMLRRPIGIGLAVLMSAEAVVMLGYRDHHGAALLAGVAIGLSLLYAGLVPIASGLVPR
jgi:membrane associated rhomboid family serine protease